MNMAKAFLAGSLAVSTMLAATAPSSAQGLLDQLERRLTPEDLAMLLEFVENDCVGAERNFFGWCRALRNSMDPNSPVGTTSGSVPL